MRRTHTRHVVHPWPTRRPVARLNDAPPLRSGPAPMEVSRVANPPPPPYVSQLNLQAHPGASPWARRHTRDVLAAWSIEGDPMDAVELAVSELVTNAIKHIQDAPELSSSPQSVRLSLRHM